MQPHSMCAVALVGFMWSTSTPVKVSSSGMRVVYTKQGAYASHSYDLSNISESADRRELRVSIMRSGGGLACTVNVRRSSLEEGCEVTITHDTQHVAGLREVFNLYRVRVSNGMSYNSMLYKGFSGEFQTLDRVKLNLTCDVKRDDDSYASVGYEIERYSTVLA
jgi:hypothetical protein